MYTVADIYKRLDEVYPFDQQEEWDNSGLLCGDPHVAVTSCIVTLDVDRACIEMAAETSAQLILSHHPILFRPVSRLLQGSVLYEAVQKGITVISAHTNFDKASSGTNTILSEKLEIATRDVPGELFRIGTLAKEQSTEALAETVSRKLNAPVSFCLGEKMVRSVAICTGAGGSEIAQAALHGVDCYITGEMKYHEYLDARAMELSVIAAGHFETEDIAMTELCARMAKEFPSVRWLKYTPNAPIRTILR